MLDGARFGGFGHWREDKEESQKCRFIIREGIFFSLPHYPAWRLRREKPGHH
jgi:hypothetical protein